jgi:hypothetical protein
MMAAGRRTLIMIKVPGITSHLMGEVESAKPTG